MTPIAEIHLLIKAITHDSKSAIDSEDAYSALFELGEVAIQALLDTLDDTSHRQHHTIASILCDILVDVGDDDALMLLQNLVNHSNNEIFTPASRAIARFQTPEINTILCQLMDHEAAQVRRVMAWQLGRNRANKAVRCLINHLDEVDLETLRGVIWSLGHIGDHRIVMHIQPFTLHISSDISFIAREAIQRIHDKSLNLPFN